MFWLTPITMWTACFLAALFSILVMPGVPKNPKGAYKSDRLSGSVKSHWCKQMLQNLHRNHHLFRHSHKCDHSIQSKYKRFYKAVNQNITRSHLDVAAKNFFGSSQGYILLFCTLWVLGSFFCTVWLLCWKLSVSSAAVTDVTSAPAGLIKVEGGILGRRGNCL